MTMSLHALLSVLSEIIGKEGCGGQSAKNCRFTAFYGKSKK